MNKKRFSIFFLSVLVALTAAISVKLVTAQDITREETAIFDIDGGRVLAPDIWNPFVPGNRRDHGFHQAMIEPLFILNYETGEFVPWLGESMTPNDALDVWTLKIRPGVKWSDGVDFTSA